jgi:hypothetical protein
LSIEVEHKEKEKDRIDWRRSKVQELASQGYNQSERSRILQISQPTINRDITYLRQQAKDNIKRYIDERLPEEYEKCLVGRLEPPGMLLSYSFERDLSHTSILFFSIAIILYYFRLYEH